MKRYNPLEIEAKWQQKWEDDGIYHVDLTDTSKPKYIGFSMLPGITGAGIHIGHGRTFQFSDIKVRAKRQQGFNAYHPIGWDSFGLPVENYAIKVGKKPREAHDEAKANFIRQLKRLGYSYDWSKEISTADPEYYRWTQWIFTKLYEHGLAYQKEQMQWWCETDNTVLANEQVEGGNCWRCGNPVTKKKLKQWFFKITEYADEILEATDELDWSPMVRTMQKNWIGKSVGAEIDFRIDGREDKLTVFTTRPDTLYGATYMAVAPEHPMLESLTSDEQKVEVEEYVKKSQSKSEIDRMDEKREKTGVFTGSYAINPINKEKIPVWVADYVLMGYGTGAIMAVPAHDDRDGAFAEKFGIEQRTVLAEDFGTPLVDAVDTVGSVVIVYDKTTEKYLGVKTGTNNGLWLPGGGSEKGESFEDTAIRELAEETGFKEFDEIVALGDPVFSYYYNDVKRVNKRSFGKGFLFCVDPSKQSEPSPEAHEIFELDWYSYDELYSGISKVEGGVEHWLEMLRRAELVNKSHKLSRFIGDGILVNSGAYNGVVSAEAREQIVAHLEREGVAREKVNFKMRDWLISRQRYWGAPFPIVHCEKDGAVSVPDDQLPVVLPDVEDYRPTGGNTSVLAGVEEWVNTTCPKCGGPAKRETDTMDGYACSSWYFLRYMDPFNTEQAWDPEVERHWGPVDFYNGADHAVAHLLYSRFWTRFFYKLGLVQDPEPFKRMMYNAYIMAPDGQKMSKSKGNVIDPLEIMDSGYGADSLRLYEMFIAPYDQEAPWDSRGVPGTYRFLNRVWTLTQEFLQVDHGDTDEATQSILQKTTHQTIKKVTEDIEHEKFNTAVSSMMEAVNTYYKLRNDGKLVKSDDWRLALESLLMVLSPFTPHITEELWHELGHEDTIHVDHWPEWDESLLVEETITMAVQVNGKVRAEIQVAKDASKEECEAVALADEKVQEYLDDKKPTRIIVVPGRLVNLVM